MPSSQPGGSQEPGFPPLYLLWLLRQDTAGGNRDGGGRKGLSEPHGFELQVPIAVKRHHGKMKHSGWKHRVFPLRHSCQQVLETTHPSARCSWRVLSLTCDQISPIILQTWPPLSSPSRRFNCTR
jgi:hypothetical protein